MGDEPASPGSPKVRISAALWRHVSKGKGLLTSKKDLTERSGERNLKPSELRNKKKALGKTRGSTKDGGAGNVLRQIAEMRGALDERDEQKREHEKQLQEVLDEFLKTENNYLLDMRMTCDKFGAPLQACCDAATHGKIFSVLPQLTGLHDVLHKDIESLTGGSSKREAAQAAERIMAAFLKLLPFFKMYSSYCTAYAAMPKHLEQLEQTNAKAKELIANAEAGGGPPLEALLFRPVQRMCVYPLLFKEALKHAEEGSQLHTRLEEAFNSVTLTIGQVNDQVRKDSERQHMAEVFLAVEGGAKLMEAARSLELETDVDMKLQGKVALLASEWRVRRRYRWLLLNDSLLVCRPNQLKSGYKKKLMMPLGELTVHSTHDPDDEADAEAGAVSERTAGANHRISEVEPPEEASQRPPPPPPSPPPPDMPPDMPPDQTPAFRGDRHAIKALPMGLPPDLDDDEPSGPPPGAPPTSVPRTGSALARALGGKAAAPADVKLVVGDGGGGGRVSSADGGQRQASGRKKAVAALWAGISSVRSSKAPDSPRDSGGRESSRGERADRWSGDRQSERASALTQSSEHKEDDKVEAFRLRFHGNEYKCWAHGEEERAEIVAKLRELKRELKREEEERIRTIGRNTAVLW